MVFIELFVGERRSLTAQSRIVHGPFDLRVDDFDFGLLAKSVHDGLCLADHELTHDRLLDVLEGRQFLVPLVFDLDDVPAEACLDSSIVQRALKRRHKS